LGYEIWFDSPPLLRHVLGFIVLHKGGMLSPGAFAAAHAPHILGDEKVDFKKEYPNYTAWMERLNARPAVKKVLQDKEKASS